MNHAYKLLAALMASPLVVAQATEVAVCTDQGRAVFELADGQSPRHVANFLQYVDAGYYTGTVFHRVLPGFVVQAGGYDRKLQARPTLPPVANESSNGLSNVRGTIAAARTQDPDSATAQFFINLEDNTPLDEPGYTVFGRVKEGIVVFDEIARLPTGEAGPFRSDVPTPLVGIRSIVRLDEARLAEVPVDGREAALKERILAAAAADDAFEALRLIDLYRAICGPADAVITLTEGRMALAAQNRPRAAFVLAEHLATTPVDDPSYEEAAALYQEAQAQGGDDEPPQRVGDCVPPAIPPLPDGTAASTEEMVTAQSRVREFVAAGERYLKCLALVIDDKKRTTVERNAAVGEHNRMVAAMEEIAAAFNEQIRKFRARG